MAAWPRQSSAMGRLGVREGRSQLLRLQSDDLVHRPQRLPLCAVPGGGGGGGGGERVVVEDPNGVSIEQCAQCLLPVGTTAGYFLLSGRGDGREVIAPLTN